MTDFDIDEFCAKAIETGRTVAGVELDYSVGSLQALDSIIQRLRSMNQKGLLNATVCWNAAVCLGTYLGEVMLRDQLGVKGFSWLPYDDGLPVIMNGETHTMASPISKVHKMILSNGEGTPGSFYAAFLWMLNHP